MISTKEDNKGAMRACIHPKLKTLAAIPTMVVWIVRGVLGLGLFPYYSSFEGVNQVG